MSDIGWLVLVGLAAWGIGDTVLGRLRVSATSSRGASALALGLAFLSYLCLALGGLGVLKPWPLRGLVVALAALSLIRSWPRLKLLRQRPQRPKWLSVTLTLLLGASVLLSILAALDPPTVLDLSHYHLRAPVFWLEHGRVSWPFKDVVYHYPQGMELLYAVGLAVGSSRLPQLVHLLTALATLWGVMSFAQRRWGSNVALLAGLFFWSIPEVYYLATMALVDLAWTGAEVLAVLAFVDGLDMPGQRERLRQWALVGALAGWAAAIKYAALWTVLLLGLGVVWASVTLTASRAERPWYALQAGIVYSTLVLALAGFWYGKNWLRFDNPVYPFLWGGRGLAPEDAQTWTAFLRLFGPSRTVARFLRLPWDIFMTQHIPAMRPGIVPYPIALAPALVVFRRWGRVATVFLMFSLAYLTAWYWTGTQQLRFVLTPMTLGCLLAAQGGGEILHRREFLAIIAAMLILVALTLGLWLEWQALASHILPSAKSEVPEPQFWPRW